MNEWGLKGKEVTLFGPRDVISYCDLIMSDDTVEEIYEQNIS